MKNFSLIALLILNFCSKLYANGPESNAWLYQSSHRKENGIAYLNDPSLWSDLPKYLFNGVSSICVRGIFLFYSQPEYQASSRNEMKLLSGNNVCTELGRTMSIQMASTFQTVFTPSIVAFSNTWLRGKAFPIDKSIYKLYGKFYGRLESFIINGKKSWTYISTTGKPYCLKPKPNPEFRFPSCILMDTLESEIGMDRQPQNIFKGCSIPKSITVEITDCVDFGATDSFDSVNDKKNDTEVIVGPPIKDCNNNDEFLSLLDLRMNNDFDEVYQMRYPKNKDHYWRTELVDSVFDVAINFCSDVVSDEYLKILREMFIYVIEKKVWSSGKGWPKQISQEVIIMNDQLDSCVDLLEDEDVIDTLQTMVSTYYDNAMSNDKPFLNTSSLREEFKRKPKLDLLMETVWLISNFAGSLCHHIAHGSNFWTDFYPLFNDMYLAPMMDHWKNPGKFPLYYPILLGGFNLELQYFGLSTCVSRAFDLSEIDIYSRPNGVIDV